MTKQLLGLDGDEHDSLLNLYHAIAEEEILDYCGRVEVPKTLVSQMAVIKFQRKGTESLSNTNYSGNGETFLKEYPPQITRRLETLKKSNRRLRTL